MFCNRGVIMAEKKKRTKKKDDEAVECYYCGKLIERANDLVIKKVPMSTKGGVKNYSRKLHLNCVAKYNEGLEDYELRAVENNEWDNVYMYFRNTVLGVDKTFIAREDSQSHMAKRLLGLRLGTYYPSGNNTRILPRGFSFNTILITMKVVNPKIQIYLKTVNFNNFKHKVDGCMRFIVGEILDVQKRIDTQRKANAKLDQDVVQPTFDYKEALRKRKKEQNKSNKGIADDVSSLLGGSLDD
jgi:hypothetical protein